MSFRENIKAILSKGGMLSGMGGGEEPKPLTPQKMKEWNGYVDFLEKKGYKGSKDLDKKETGLAKALLAEYAKSTGASLTYDDVPLVQQEMDKLKTSAQAFAKRRNEKDADKVMEGTSKVDGWPGSKTTSFKFPNMETEQYHNDSLIKKQNLGLVSGMLTPATSSKPTEQLKDGKYYTNADGDLVKQLK